MENSWQKYKLLDAQKPEIPTECQVLLKMVEITPLVFLWKLGMDVYQTIRFPSFTISAAVENTVIQSEGAKNTFSFMPTIISNSTNDFIIAE